MVDLILILAIGVTFAAGFWVGKTFGTVGATIEAAKNKIKAWLA